MAKGGQPDPGARGEAGPGRTWGIRMTILIILSIRMIIPRILTHLG